MKANEKHSFTHYYVQAQQQGKEPEIVYHTFDKEENEYYHKFFDRSKAVSLAKAEKKIDPNTRFRVVKLTETYQAGEWI